MRTCLLSIILLLTCITGRAETLRELLAGIHLPDTNFNALDLAQTVQGEAKSHDRETVLVYNEVRGELLLGPLHVVRLGQRGEPTLRANLVIAPEENCDGGVLGISFLHRFTVLAMHINPSATCLLFLDKRFHIVRKVYGVDWHEVSPYRLAIVENNIHFAPVHPERLLMTDLRHRGSLEVYPIKGDALRAEFIAEHSKHIPSEDICSFNNDPCSPEAFDEDILSLTTNGKGKFAFLATLNALHPPAKGARNESVLSQNILYVYRANKGSWLYCQQAVRDSHATEMRDGKISPLDQAACVPNLPVVPDRTTEDYSPFVKTRAIRRQCGPYRKTKKPRLLPKLRLNAA